MIVISCFDKTTNMIKPWAKAGYLCYCVDLQHPPGEKVKERNIITVGADVQDWLPPREEIKIAFFFPPCTDVAVSGARWFKDKGLGGLIDALKLFDASVKIAEWSKAPYMIENPVSTVSTYWRKPDHIFQPWEFGENYTKKTCLWTGNGFQMPKAKVLKKPKEVKGKIWLMPPSKERANIRSITPITFAEAVYEANK